MISEANERDLQLLEKIITTEFPYKKMQGQKLIERIRNPEIKIFKKTEAGKIIGFAEVQRMPEFWMLNAISVLPEERGKGHAKELLGHALEFMAHMGAAKVRLLVKKGNLRAKKLYNAAGFAFAGIHPKLIEGSTVEVWEKPLRNENAKYLN